MKKEQATVKKDDLTSCKINLLCNDVLALHSLAGIIESSIRTINPLPEDVENIFFMIARETGNIYDSLSSILNEVEQMEQKKKGELI